MQAAPDLGPGLDPQACGEVLARLDSDLDLAVIVRLPQLTPVEKMGCWQRCRGALGLLGVGVDLVVAGSADAERLSGSRWHVFGDVAREGRVLYVAG